MTFLLLKQLLTQCRQVDLVGLRKARCWCHGDNPLRGVVHMRTTNRARRKRVPAKGLAGIGMTPSMVDRVEEIMAE